MQRHLSALRHDRARQDAEWRAHQDREKLARASIRYVQLREALDRSPTLKEFGISKFVFYTPVLDGDLIEKWNVGDYVNHVLTHRNAERADDAARLVQQLIFEEIDAGIDLGNIAEIYTPAASYILASWL